MRDRFSIYISLNKANGEIRYLFRDNSDEMRSMSKAVEYGTPLLFFKDGFFSMRDPHDAILFCNYLNDNQPNA